MAAIQVAEVALVAYLYLAVLSGPVAIFALSLARFVGSIGRTLGYVAATLLVVNGLGGLAAANNTGVGRVVVAAAVFLGGAVGLGAIPLLVGRAVGHRLTGRPPDRALGDALVGWPFGMVAGLVVLSSGAWAPVEVGPAGATDPRLAAVAVALAVLAPTVLGVAIGRIRSGSDATAG